MRSPPDAPSTTFGSLMPEAASGRTICLLAEEGILLGLKWRYSYLNILWDTRD